MFLNDSQEEHVFKNIVFLRNHHISRYQLKVFAPETLYRWSIFDAENDHLYNVCEAENVTRYNGFNVSQEMHEFTNIAFWHFVK